MGGLGCECGKDAQTCDSDFYESETAYRIWDHTDKWFLNIKLTRSGWEVKEEVWAISPLTGKGRYFSRWFPIWNAETTKLLGHETRYD